MIDATFFAFTNVGIGFVVSWILTHYLLPLFFSVPRNATRATIITLIYTVAALIRNVVIYGVWTQ